MPLSSLGPIAWSTWTDALVPVILGPNLLPEIYRYSSW